MSKLRDAFPWYQEPPPVFACQPPRSMVKMVDPDYKPLSIIEDFDRWFRVTLLLVEASRRLHRSRPTPGGDDERE